MKLYLGVGVVFQVPDQAGAEVADIGLDLSDVVAETVQFGHNDLVTVRAAVPMPARYQSPGHDDHQDSDGSDDLGQPCQVFHIMPAYFGCEGTHEDGHQLSEGRRSLVPL